MNEMKPKMGKICFRYFQADEYVRTPQGCGIVMEDEKEIKFVDDYLHSKIKIQHKFYTVGVNPTNEPVWFERNLVCHITALEYGMEYQY